MKRDTISNLAFGIFLLSLLVILFCSLPLGLGLGVLFVNILTGGSITLGLIAVIAVLATIAIASGVSFGSMPFFKLPTPTKIEERKEAIAAIEPTRGKIPELNGKDQYRSSAGNTNQTSERIKIQNSAYKSESTGYSSYYFDSKKDESKPRQTSSSNYGSPSPSPKKSLNDID